MCRISQPSIDKGKQGVLGGAVLGILGVLFSTGCTNVDHRYGEQRSHPILTSDVRQPIP